MEILIISGMSGAGKSRAAICLEDSGYYIVDNLPAEMMVKFAEFCAAAGGRYDRLAFVYDVRAGEPFERLTGAVEELRRQGLRCRLLFLEADTKTIINRYKETRRSHPLCGDGASIEEAVARERAMLAPVRAQADQGLRCRLLFLEADTKTIINRYKETRRSHPLCGDGASIEEAVARERAMLAPVRAQADLVLDTSAFSAAKLRSTLLTLLGGGSGGGLHVTVLSFGFKNGLPPEADLVLDVRFLPNPYYVPELKRLTGLDVAVRDYVMNAAATEEFWRRLTPMVDYLLPQYRQEGRTELVLAVGCTGGRHRSVAVAHRLAAYIDALGFSVAESHRDMGR